MTIPVEVMTEHFRQCKDCPERKTYQRMDFHIDWIDCPYDCENDLEHWKGAEDDKRRNHKV